MLSFVGRVLADLIFDLKGRQALFLFCDLLKYDPWEATHVHVILLRGARRATSIGDGLLQRLPHFRDALRVGRR